MKKIFKKYYTIIPLFLLCAFYLNRSYGFVIHDFGNYYFGSLLFKLNQFSAEVYAPCYFNTLVNELGFEFFGTYLPFTPITTLFFFPFTFFDPYIAKFIFNSISILLFLNTIFRAFKFFKLDVFYCLLLPFIFFIPVRNGILFGQFYLILFVLITESYIFYRQGKKWLAALLLSIAIVIKIFPVIFLFWFFSIKDLKQVLRIIIIIGLIILISVFINGFNIWSFYIVEILKPSLNGSIGLDFLLNYQSADIFFKFLFVQDSYFNETPLINNYNLFVYFNIVFKSLIIALGFIMPYFIKSKHIQFGFWIMISLLISPNGSTYSLVLLIIPLLAVLSNKSISDIKIFITIGIIIIICNLPWDFFQSNLLILKFTRLLFLLLLFTLLYKWYSKRFPIFKFLTVFGLFLTIQILKPNPKKAYAETIYGGRSIICNYEIENENLLIEEFKLKGKTKKKILNIKRNSFTYSLILKKNQLYLDGKQLTNTKDHKLNPIIVNDKIFFLSDFDQGYKIYSLKSINIPK